MTDFKTSYNVTTGQVTKVPLTAEEIAEREAYVANEVPQLLWQQLRRERNKRIQETDYLALSDVTLSDEMRTYRQALRDLPASTSDPANPTWPTKPGG